LESRLKVVESKAFPQVLPEDSIVSEKESTAVQADSRRQFWLQQYATAFSTGDKRAAAVALQFAQQYNKRVITAVRRKSGKSEPQQA
jgi:hypothetical protein